MNFEDLKKLTESGIGLAVASRDKDMIPHLDDLLGLQLSSDGQSLIAFINSEEAQATLTNLQTYPQLAISMSRPCDYFAAQIKGRVTAIRQMTEMEQSRSRQWADLYRQEMVLVNVPPETIASLVMEPDTTLEVMIEDFFIQTPGAQAGKRLVRG